MTPSKSTQQLAKFLDYVVARRPDAFGLVPDEEGYIRIKDLLKALSEEEGWRHVRRANLNEVVLTIPDPPVELTESRIRAVDRKLLPKEIPAGDMPKLIYTCVRKKAHPVVLEKGIRPTAHTKVILAADEELARRMGRRSDSAPVLLTVQTECAKNEGVLFSRLGESLYLAGGIPAGCFTAPALPKEKPEAKKPGKNKEAPKVNKEFMPGSFILDIPEEGKEGRRDKKKRDIDKKRARREKERMREGERKK